MDQEMPGGNFMGNALKSDVMSGKVGRAWPLPLEPPPRPPCAFLIPIHIVTR